MAKKLKQVGYGSVENSFGVRITKGEQKYIKKMQRQFKKQRDIIQGSILGDIENSGLSSDDILEHIPKIAQSGSMNQFTSAANLKNEIKRLKKAERKMKKGNYGKYRRDIWSDNHRKELEKFSDCGKQGERLADLLNKASSESVELMGYLNSRDNITFADYYITEYETDEKRRQLFLKKITNTLEKVMKGRGEI